MSGHDIHVIVRESKHGPEIISRYLQSRIVNLIAEGLQTDGAHHKQYFLERILLQLYNQMEFDAALEDEDWERGIAP